MTMSHPWEFPLKIWPWQCRSHPSWYFLSKEETGILGNWCHHSASRSWQFLTFLDLHCWMALELWNGFGMALEWLPSGELTFCHGKSPFLMGKSTISMAIFHSFLYVHRRVDVSKVLGCAEIAEPPATLWQEEVSRFQVAVQNVQIMDVLQGQDRLKIIGSTWLNIPTAGVPESHQSPKNYGCEHQNSSNFMGVTISYRYAASHIFSPMYPVPACPSNCKAAGCLGEPSNNLILWKDLRRRPDQDRSIQGLQNHQVNGSRSTKKMVLFWWWQCLNLLC